MSGISFKFNGRDIRPDDLAGEMTKSIMEASHKIVNQRLEDCICPVHGTKAQVVPQPGSPDQWNFNATYCCEAHKAAAMKQFGGGHA
jgi:hypothetical protein